MIVRSNENHGECVIVLKIVTSLVTVINGSIFAKCLFIDNSIVGDMPGVILFFGNFMNEVKRKPAAQ